MGNRNAFEASAVGFVTRSFTPLLPLGLVAVVCCSSFSGTNNTDTTDSGVDLDGGAADALVTGEPARLKIAVSDPRPAELIRGKSVDVVVTLTRPDELQNGDVTVSVGGLPPGITAKTLTILGSATTGTLTLTSSSATSQGLTSPTLRAADAAQSLTSPDTRFDLLSRGEPGTLDETFGKNGVVELNTTSDTSFSAMALQADSKLLFASSVFVESANFNLGRLLADGTIDSSFGNNGTLPLTFDGTPSNSAKAILVQPDGKVVIVGYTGSDATTGLLRLTRSGQLDTTFGGTFGKTIVTVASVRDAALASDGSTFVLGTDGANGLVLAKVGANGTLDTGFGTGGYRSIPASVFTGGTSISPYSVVCSGGKVLVSTMAHRASGYETSIGILTMLQTGAAAPIVGDTFSSFKLVNGGTAPLVVRSDGAAVVAYNVNADQTQGSEGFGIYGFDSDGHSPANFFNVGPDNGRVYSPIPDHPNAMALDDRQRYVIAAASGISSYPFRVLRRLPSGWPDTSFASSDGIASTPIGDTARAMSVALQVDRRIVVGGDRKTAEATAVAFARYWP